MKKFYDLGQDLTEYITNLTRYFAESKDQIVSFVTQWLIYLYHVISYINTAIF